MKLSNKILIGFFGFIFVYLMAGFTEIRFRGNMNVLDDSTGIKESVDLIEIRYLIFRDLDESITVIGSDEAKLEVHSISGDLLHRLEYKVYGDTLELTQLQLEENENVDLTVRVSTHLLNGIEMHGATVVVDKLNQKQLRIIQNSGRIRFSEENKLNKLDVISNNGGQLDFEGTKLDTLSIQLDDSNVSINAGSMRVEGNLVNESFLWMSDVDEIQVKKDRSSQFNFN